MLNFIIRRSVYILVGVAVLTIIPACNKNKENKDDDESEIKENNRINDWILENMEVYYFWNTQIPRTTDKNLAPTDYFKSLLYTTEDRFSWIQEDFTELQNSLSGVVMEAGYDYDLSILSRNRPEVIGHITYIKPNSPAERTELKRGDFFMTVNGKQITTDNYQALTGEMGAAHTLGIVNISNLADLTVVKEISLSVVKYEENPILLDTIYRINDKKIAYLVYTFFAPDNGNGSYSYEKELNNLFGKFKSEQVDELILDLRYNGGGYISTATALCSMISDKGANVLLAVDQYNSILDAYFKQHNGANYNRTYFVDEVVKGVPINHLGMEKLYVLTSWRTASASELIINGLNPYMNVVIVGEVTYGKNVGSFTIYETDAEKQKTNKWGMLPIVLKLANSVGFSDYGDGFTPDVAVDELDDLSFKPLGDIDEVVLQAAVDRIFGQTKKTRAAVRQFDRIGSSVDRTPARQNMYKSIPR